MEEFAWRPAALRSERRVAVSPEGLCVDGGALLPWDGLEAISFALNEVRRATMMTVRLQFADGAVAQLSVNGQGPEVERYVAMLRAVIGAAAAARPEMRVALGHIGGARWGMFAVGAALALAGLGLAGLGVALGVSGDIGGGLGLGVTGLLVTVMAGAMTAANRPDQAPPDAPIAGFLAELGLPDS